MGLPIARLVIATNANDILARTLATGRYETATVTRPSSPSMDIQVSSNFERLLFEALWPRRRRPSAPDGRPRQDRPRSPSPAEALAAIRADFAAGRADEAETAADHPRAPIAATGFLADPHTAVGLAVASASPSPPCPWSRSPPPTRRSSRGGQGGAGVEPPLPAWLASPRPAGAISPRLPTTAPPSKPSSGARAQWPRKGLSP